MILVVDTNRIIAGLLRDSVTREILLHPDLVFLAPDFILMEIRKHRNLILSKSGLSEDAFEDILDTLFSKISIIPRSEFESHLEDAYGLIGHIDPDDVAFIALSLGSENGGIWTDDRDFEKQYSIRVWKTRDLIDYLELSIPR